MEQLDSYEWFLHHVPPSGEVALHVLRTRPGRRHDTTMNTLKLKDIVEWVVPDGKIMGCQFHTAGADAQLHALVYIELAKLAQSTVSRG